MSHKSLDNLVKKEILRQNESISLIPSENIASPRVLGMLGSPLTNKYAEGYPGKRYYGGNSVIDEIEKLCHTRAMEVFGLSENEWHVNVQPYSGSPANLAVYAALVPFGKKIMGLRLDMGGHLTHGHIASITGKWWKQVPYTLDEKTHLLNFKEIRAMARREKPRLIVAGFTAYSRQIDFKEFRKIADEIGAYFMADISHIAGLVAGKAHPSPFKYADVVTTTTHKTLRGPRGAMIFTKLNVKCYESNISIASAIDKAVFPGLQGGPHMNQIAAIVAALEEAKTPSFGKYARQVVKNAKELALHIAKHNWQIISGGTDTHLFLINTAARGLGGAEASELLEKSGVIVNKNTIPYDTRPPSNPSGIRLGTPSATTRGMKEKEMRTIANIIDKTLLGKNTRKEVLALCKRFPIKK